MKLKRHLYITSTLVVFFFHPCQLFSQTKDTAQGIKWVTGLSWDQVKQKAKAENKYIFLDCFATWCGPCKQMEKAVFTKSGVGKFFNEKFISIRVQIDRVENDNRSIKSWYADAAAINRKYKIIAFPTFLFFKPDGSIIYKERGYQGPSNLISIAKRAILPGRKYEDPYKEYDSYLELYSKGERNYKKMPAMIDKAKEIGDRTILKALVKEYFGYLEQRKKEEWYTKTNIKFISENLTASSSPFFKLFYPDGREVNKRMEKNEFARYIVDRVINEETIKPFLDSFIALNSVKTIKAGATPSWDSIGRVLTSKYSNDFVARALRKGKRRFYWLVLDVDSSNLSLLLKNENEIITNHDLDLGSFDSDVWINTSAWQAFLRSSKESEIKMVTQWMKDLVSRDNEYSRKGTQYFIFDTYANLLYKSAILFHTDTLSEALIWQKKAMQAHIDKRGADDEGLNRYEEIIEKMKKRLPTWN
jgi:thioredoxin-related protein